MTSPAALGAIAQFALFVAAGFVCRRAGVLEGRWDAGLRILLIDVAAPLVVLGAVVRVPLGARALPAAGVAWAVSLAGMSVAWEIAQAFRLEPPAASAFALAGALGSTGFIGIPLVGALVGGGAQAAAATFDALGTVAVLLTLGVAVAARYGDERGAARPLRAIATFPPTIAFAVALCIRLLPLPSAVSNAVAGWSGAAAMIAMPVILFAVGAALDLRTIRTSIGALGALTGIKLLMMPALAAAIATFMKYSGGTHVVALQAGMPSVVLAIAVGERFRLDTRFVAAALVVTAVAAVATLPIVHLVLP